MNTSKSKNFFSNNCDDNLCNQISNILTIKRVNNLGKYLGFPIQTNSPKHSDFNQLITKLESKLCTKFLTMAGRVTLVKSVLSAIPTNTMQCFNLPSKITEAINKILGTSFGDLVRIKGNYILSIDKQSVKQKNGRLQIKDAKIQNQALLTSLAWKFLTSKQNTPWIFVLSSKYLKQQTKNPFQILN